MESQKFILFLTDAEMAELSRVIDLSKQAIPLLELKSSLEFDHRDNIYFCETTGKHLLEVLQCIDNTDYKSSLKYRIEELADLQRPHFKHNHRSQHKCCRLF